MSDDNDGRFNLSRRKALAGLGSIGAASAVGGLGTTALFSDDESVSSTFTAGELDLRLDWRTHVSSYNGQSQTQTEPVDVGEGTERGVVSFDFSDLKQCDEACIVFSLHVEDNPAWVWFGSEVTADHEGDNGVNEPEAQAGDNDADGGFSTMDVQNAGDGELDNFLQSRSFYDDSNDCQKNANETALDDWRYVTDPGLLSSIADNGGILLDGIRNEEVSFRSQGSTTPYLPEDESKAIHATPFFPDVATAEAELQNWWGGNIPHATDRLPDMTGTQYFAIQIQMPCDQEGVDNPVNQAQGDVLEMDFSFYAEQARNNAFPRSPWDDNLPDVPVDAVPGVTPSDGGSGFTASAANANYHKID